MSREEKLIGLHYAIQLNKFYVYPIRTLELINIAEKFNQFLGSFDNEDHMLKRECLEKSITTGYNDQSGSHADNIIKSAELFYKFACEL